ncbi:hypothetical protein V6N11_077829 [Hibiscus sabdariffa]|uniref:Uncharacterized protein n=1 Tax=Hibiscus sabdariffa TaxID=183260 RepID=A0ABR2TE84_9ROSI
MLSTTAPISYLVHQSYITAATKESSDSVPHSSIFANDSYRDCSDHLSHIMIFDSYFGDDSDYFDHSPKILLSCLLRCLFQNQVLSVVFFGTDFLVVVFFELSSSALLSELLFSSALPTAVADTSVKNMAAISFRVLMSVALVLAIVSSTVEAQSAAAPAPSPTSDGTSIDQGIAYILMLVALVLTYLIHPLDASSYTLF